MMGQPPMSDAVMHQKNDYMAVLRGMQADKCETHV